MSYNSYDSQSFETLNFFIVTLGDVIAQVLSIMILA